MTRHLEENVWGRAVSLGQPENGESTKTNPDLIEMPRPDFSSFAKIPRLSLCSAGGSDFMGCSGNPTFSTVRIGGGTWLPVSILFRLRIPWRWGRRPRVRPSRPGRSIPTSAAGSPPPTWGRGDRPERGRPVRCCRQLPPLTCPTPTVPCPCPRWTAWIRSGRRSRPAPSRVPLPEMSVTLMA